MTAPALTATAVALGLVERTVAWLDAANGRGAGEVRLRLFKVAEEYGEVCDELDREPISWVAVARESVDVVITAMTAQVSLRHTPTMLWVDRPADLGAVGGLDVLALRLGKEVGQLGGVVIGEAGQNPRKGRHKTVADVIAQLDKVIVAALRLIAALGFDPASMVIECAQRVSTRIDEVGVPTVSAAQHHWAYTVTFDGDTHWLVCDVCSDLVTAVEAGDSLERIVTRARDHERSCRQARP